MSEKTRKLIYCAVFISISIALSYLSGFFTVVRVSLAPILIMFAGAALGPFYGGITGAVTDLVTFFIRPTGVYFPGFTLTMILYGVLAGLLFYRKEPRQQGYSKIILGVVGIQTLCSAFLNTLWLHFLMETPYLALLATRLPITYISCAVYVVVLCVLIRNRERIIRPVPAASNA